MFVPRPDFGATIFPRDEKDAPVVDHLKDQHRVDHGSALAIRGLQKEIDELKKKLEVIGSNKKVTKSKKCGCHIENKIVGILQEKSTKST